MPTEPTKNAVCQRVGHFDSGRRTASGKPICSTCRMPFDDTDPPFLSLFSFEPDDPDGVAIVGRRYATEEDRQAAPAESAYQRNSEAGSPAESAGENEQSAESADLPRLSPAEYAIAKHHMSVLRVALGYDFRWSIQSV